MKFALGNFWYPLYPFERLLSDMQRLNVKYVEVWAGAPHLYLCDETPATLRAKAAAMRAAGLTVVCLTPEQCAYPVNIAAEEPAARRRSMEYLRLAIDAAAEMNIPKVLVTPGQGYRDRPPAEAFSRSAEALHELSGYGRQRGVGLLLEHLTAATTNLAITCAQLKTLAEAAEGGAWLQPMADLDMLARVGEGLGDFMAAFGHCPAHVHLVDGMPGGHLVPGEGVIDLAGQLRLLEAWGYQGCVSLEIMHERYLLQPGRTAARALCWLRENGFAPAPG